MKNIVSRHLLIALTFLGMSHALANPPTAPINPTENLRKIEGDIFIMPRETMAAAGETDSWRRQIERALQITLDSDAALVYVWATSRDDANSPTPGAGITAREGAPLEKELTAEGQKQAYDVNWRTVHLGNKNTKAIAAATEKSDNWSCHGHPVLGNVFPSALPYDLLKDKKEGDVLEVIITNAQGEKIVASLRCKQNGYRYGEHRFGRNFEGWLTYLHNNYTAEELLTSVAREYAYNAVRKIGVEKVLDTCRNDRSKCRELFAQSIAPQSK